MGLGWGEATPRAGRHWGPSHSPSWDVTNVSLAHGTQARLFSAEWGAAVLQEGPRVSNSTLRGAVRAEGGGQCAAVDEMAVVVAGEAGLAPAGGGDGGGDLWQE